MTTSKPQDLETALGAAETAVLLESSTQVAHAAEVWSRQGRLGLDTEFVRERTYRANIGLVQVSDGQTVWLLDPLAGGTLDPLVELLGNRDIAKIVHSPSEDLDLLLHATGALPEPVLDTQIACAMLGQPLQVGYHMAAQWLLGVAIDKDQTRSNWCARPLRPAQLRYAALDVCLLPLMWHRLEAMLAEKDRLGWFLEDCQRQIDRAREPLETSECWQRIRGSGRLDGHSLAVLQRLGEWREEEAQRRNRPRGFIIPDNLLLIIADRKMASTTELGELENLHPRARERYADTVVRIVSDSLAADRPLQPVNPLTPQQRKLLKRLRRRVSEVAKSLAVEPALLAPKKELEELVQLNGSGRLPARLKGWRKTVITDELLPLLDGAS
jgi:ribonuclease D